MNRSGDGVDPCRLLRLIAPLLYIAYALLTPPFQTPDEHQHLFRAYQLAAFQLVGSHRGQESGGLLPPGLARAAEAEIGSAAPLAPRPLTRRPPGEIFSRATPVATDEPWRFVNFVGSASYSPAGYVPQIFAIWIGQWLGLSVEGIIRLGRLANALLTFALIDLAMAILPIGRLMLLILALMPMTAACAGSFGQDGPIIGAACGLTAIGLRVLTQRRWRPRDVVMAGVLTLAVTLTKMVYMPLVAIAMLPVPRGRAWWRWWAPPVAMALVACALLILWLRTVAELPPPQMPGVPPPVTQIASAIANPLTFAEAAARTYKFGTFALVEQLFTFGWLNVGPPILSLTPAFGAVVAGVWQGDRNAALLHWNWRVWMTAILMAIVLMLTFALYIAATPPGTPVVLGLQGRYYLPLGLPLLLLLLRRSSGREELAGVAVMLVMIANAAALAMIGIAFYDF